ncbi:hypothetical protein LPJ63_004609 [Coemansia sp. RSA 2711]|nr:hypothetical protein LPJ63_004609 [Coemansia sp. RSA 2711]
MAHEWFDGTLVRASAQATRQNRLLIACIVAGSDDGNSQEKQTLEQLFSQPQILPVVSSRCLCILLETGTEQAAIFAKLFPSNTTPTIYLIHSSGNTMLAADNIEVETLLEHIQTRLAAVDSADKESKPDIAATPLPTPAPAAAEKHLDAHEAERYRRMLVKRRQQDAQRLRLVREDMKEDRKTYEMVHGRTKIIQTETVPVKARETKAARLQFRASNGTTKTADFTRDTPFTEVRAYAESAFEMPAGKLEIGVSFPQRKVLDSSADALTLAQLGLVPSATLFVRVWDRTPAAKPKTEAQKTNPASAYFSVYVALTALALALLFWHIRTPPPAFAQ